MPENVINNIVFHSSIALSLSTFIAWRIGPIGLLSDEAALMYGYVWLYKFVFPLPEGQHTREGQAPSNSLPRCAQDEKKKCFCCKADLSSHFCFNKNS